MPRFVALALAASIVARSSAARVDASIDSGALRDAGALLDVPSDDAAWYAAASWDENHYARALGTSTGRATTVTTTAELLAALRDPLVEFVGVNATTLTLDEDAWPRRGVAVRRRVALRGACDGRCVVDANGTSVASVVDGGNLSVERMAFEGARGDFGGAFYFGRAHGGGSFDDAAFRGCEAREGGAVFVASDASAGNVVFRNVTFESCGATATNGRGGGAFVAASGPAYVAFESCAFEGNVANGLGGGGYADGGHVVINECEFKTNAAASGGGAALRGGGVVSSSAFDGNDATRAGGGVHVASPSDVVVGHRASSVQRSAFTNNTAAVAGAGAFAYGRVKMLANTFSRNALPASAPSALDPNYYVCTDTSDVGCSMKPTLADDVYDPAAYDPFTPQTSFATVPETTTTTTTTTYA